MTNYNLEEFKDWLEANESQKEIALDWEYNFKTWIKTDVHLEKLIKKEDYPQGANFSGNGWDRYRRVVQNWLAEREQSQNEEGNPNMINAQDWLNEKFPAPESKAQIIHLVIEMPGAYVGRNLNQVFGQVMTNRFDAHLEGELDLKGFTNLKSLSLGGKDGSGQGLTSIDLSDCKQLKVLELSIFCNSVEVKGLENLTELTTLKTYFCQTKMFGFLERWQQEIQSLKTQLAESQERERTRAELAQQRQALEEQIQAKEQEFQQNTQALQTNIQQSKQEITQHLARIQDLETRLATKTNELTQAQTNLTNTLQSLQDLQQENQTSTTSLRQEIAELKKASVSKKELETEQKKLQIAKDALKTSQDNLKASETTIASLNDQIANLEQTKKATEEKLLKTTQASLAQEQQKEQLQKDLTKSLQQLAQDQETRPLLEKKITDLETALFNLAKQKLKGKKEASELVAQLETNCQAHQETLTRKSKELSKLRIEVVSLQTQLKKAEKPKPDRLPNKAEPISPWLLGTILVAGIGLFLVLKRRKE